MTTATEPSTVPPGTVDSPSTGNQSIAEFLLELLDLLSREGKLSDEDRARLDRIRSQFPQRRPATPELPATGLFTIPQVAQFLAVSVQTVRRLTRRKEIRATLVGDAVRIKRTELDKYVERNTGRNRRSSRGRRSDQMVRVHVPVEPLPELSIQ